MSRFLAIASGKETTFGELVSTVSTNNKKVQKREYLESGRFPVVDQGQQFIGGYCNDESKVISEDLPLLVFGDHTRTFKYLDQPFVPGADGVKVLKPLGVSAKWLYHIAHALDFPDKGYARHFQHLKNAKLRVPPLPDQRRIVEEIEKQFSRLEVGVAALRRVQANLKRYRAAALKAACEGRLVHTEAELAKVEGRTYETGEQLLARILVDRRKNWHGRGKYKEPAVSDHRGLPEFPKHWTIASLEQLTSATRPICYGILMPKEHVPGGVLYVKVKDMKNDRIDVSSLNRTAPEIAAKYSRASLKAGDLLLSIRGTYGRVVEAPEELDGGNITQDTARLDVTKLVDHRFVALCLRNPDCQNYFKRVARGVAVKGVNIADVRTTPVPLPPLAEQKLIVAGVERCLSVIEELEAAVTANLQRATRLRQSILRRAFVRDIGETSL